MFYENHKGVLCNFSITLESPMIWLLCLSTNLIYKIFTLPAIVKPDMFSLILFLVGWRVMRPLFHSPHLPLFLTHSNFNKMHNIMKHKQAE